MAKTKNGIVYPDNYDKVADVPADLKELAESVDEVIENNKTEMKKSNETRDGKISKNTENIEAIQGSIKTATETINKKDNEQDEDIKANKETIKEIQAENERLREDIKSIATIGEASGENIHLEDSSEARCELEICGNHQQETREGYNQLKNEGTTQTLNNVTITKKEDETLVVNGTATEDFTFSIKINIELEDGEQYKLSGCPNGGAEKKYALTINQYYENQSHFVQDYGDGVNFTYNGSLPINNNIYIRLFKGITYNNLIFKPMIVKGTEQKPYEQYGASPSIDYPSPIKSVGNIKNILNMSNAKNGASAGIACTMNADGSYKYKGTATSQYINVWFMGGYATDLPTLFTLEPGTYYINDVSLFEGTTGFANDSSKKIWTFIRAYNVTGVRAPNAVSGNTYDETKYPIIAKIDHEIPWVPYEMGYIKVNEFNKNYLSTIPQMSFSLQGIQTTFDGEKFICKGTAMYNYFNLTPKRIAHYFKVGTYTFSSNMFKKGRACIRFYHEDGTEDTYYSNINTKKISFTLKKDAYAYFLMVDGLTVGGGDVIDCIIKLQLEDGNTSTEIVKAENQEYLVDVQQEMLEGDTFVRQDGKWYEKHCVKTEIMLTFPTTNIEVCGTFADFQTNRNIAFAVVKNDLKITNVRNDILCDKLKAKDNSMWGGKEEGIQTYINSNKFMISIPFEDIEKNFGEELTINNYSQAFRKYINDNGPFKIYYKLAEPILLECTKAQSKVLDEIYSKAHTYKNITNISAESSEVNPIINVKYLKDAETEHNKLQAQIDEIKQLLSTTETSALLVNNLEKDLRMEV